MYLNLSVLLAVLERTCSKSLRIFDKNSFLSASFSSKTVTKYYIFYSYMKPKLLKNRAPKYKRVSSLDAAFH